MNSDMVVRKSTLTEKVVYARELADSNLLPKEYRKQPANLLFALEYADALGVSPINAITSIHVIEGKPSASADLIAGLIRRAGHKLRITQEPGSCTVVGIRTDDPDNPFTATWTTQDAKDAGLLSKPVWKAYGRAMLRSRAITEVGRMGFTDCTMGLSYAPEELGVTVDEQGNPVYNHQPSTAASRSGADRLEAALGEVVEAEELPAHVFIEQALGSDSIDELRVHYAQVVGHSEAGRIREAITARVAELKEAALITDAVLEPS